MAKKAPVGEEPYRPLLDPNVITSALLKPAPAPAEVRDEPKVIELPRTAEPKTHPHTVRPAQAVPPEPAPQPAQPLVEKFDHEKRILFTRPETQAIDRLVSALATRLNAQVKVSHVMRAVVALLLNAEREIDRRAGEKGPLVRPANGDAKALQRFERDIAAIIADALRDAGPLR